MDFHLEGVENEQGELKMSRREWIFTWRELKMSRRELKMSRRELKLSRGEISCRRSGLHTVTGHESRDLPIFCTIVRGRSQVDTSGITAPLSPASRCDCLSVYTAVVVPVRREAKNSSSGTLIFEENIHDHLRNCKQSSFANEVTGIFIMPATVRLAQFTFNGSCVDTCETANKV